VVTKVCQHVTLNAFLGNCPSHSERNDWRAAGADHCSRKTTLIFLHCSTSIQWFMKARWMSCYVINNIVSI